MSEKAVTVLLSGGLDSAALLQFYVDLGREVEALHVHYGQPAEEAEAEAANRVAEFYSVPIRIITYGGTPNIDNNGVIEGRNLFLLGAGCMEARSQTRVLAIGIHSGTQYSDCSPAFLESVNEAIRISTKNRVTVAAPFLEWSKGEILRYCREYSIPVQKTYSCERSCTPCGECMSCKDRARIC